MEGRKASTKCVNEQITTVGNWGSVLLTPSERLYRKYAESAHQGARKLGNSSSLLGTLTPGPSGSQRASSGRGMQVLEVGSHRYKRLPIGGAGDLRTGLRGLGRGTDGTYYIHCPLGKGSNLWKVYLHRMGKGEIMGEKISVEGRCHSEQSQ